ncbi:MAG: sigma-54 dependent transcriptional regulator [Geobacteraceae bacterium]|nr:sigma-54 dependent transcriptional regulator [Geobacteraceae bacterium]
MKNTANLDLPSVLLVDDEEQILFSSAALLRRAAVRNVKTISDSRDVLPILAGENVGTIVLDLFMPHVSGKDLLAHLYRDYPHIPVIVMTAAHDLETAVDCMKTGAFDYLLKPVENARFISSVSKAMEIFTLKSQMALLEQHLFDDRVEQPAAFESIVTVSKKMQTVFQYCEVIGRSRQPVLITGETGTGKELVARAVHAVSGLAGKFIPVNVAGLDDNLFTDTLFGHRKGAYTGAEEARRGLIESAAEGTLFLDEIGDLSESSQVKLLRLLQEQEYYSIGSDIPKKSSSRIIASTNRDLREEVSRGTFRRDLYYRICAHRVIIPPLRERPEDIPCLLGHFLRKASKKLDKRRPSPPPQLFALLSAYPFPGNVRELEAMVFDAVARHASGILSLTSFREAVSRKYSVESLQPLEPTANGSLPLRFPEKLPTLHEAETLLVNEAMKRSGGNQGIAASLLGISRSALNKRLRKTD